MITGNQDQRYYSYALYRNAYQLLAQFITLANSKYFKDPQIHNSLEDISLDFDFIKEYYKTYLQGQIISNESKLVNYESYCRAFQQKIIKL